MYCSPSSGFRKVPCAANTLTTKPTATTVKATVVKCSWSQSSMGNPFLAPGTACAEAPAITDGSGAVNVVVSTIRATPEKFALLANLWWKAELRGTKSLVHAEFDMAEAASCFGLRGSTRACGPFWTRLVNCTV